MSKLDKKDYKRALKAMQRELVDLARWVAESGTRIVVLFEGRDSAGKGGVIGAIREHLNPRQTRVVALPKPDEREKGEWYFQRYVAHLPSAGEIVLFDRSWYNRAGVEKVMGFATEAEVEAFLAATPVFEKLLTDDGIILVKYWLTCDQEKQEERFAERHEDPLKGWKLSPMDVAAREMYDEYTRARETMLKATQHRQRAVDAGRFQQPEAGPADADPRPDRPHSRLVRPARTRPPAAARGGSRTRRASG